jgi:leucyl aminopeptidase
VLQVSTIVGDELLKQNYPHIHTVGRAAAEGREPRLIDLKWGDASRSVTRAPAHADLKTSSKPEPKLSL